MNCQGCESKRVAFVSAKCSDLFSYEVSGKGSDGGYVPRGLGVGGGDYVEMSYCLNCGQLQGKFPLPPLDIETQAEPEEDQPCEFCGTEEGVAFEPDPYASDIDGDSTPHWICGPCCNSRADDI